MGFDDPKAKMSKSIGEKKKRHSISLLDSPEEIKDTIMRAATDSDRETRFDYASPGIKNILVLYEALTKKSRTEIEDQFSDGKYGKLKKELSEAVIAELEPIQKKYRRIIKEESYLDDVLKQGEDRAAEIAAETMVEVKEAMGLK